MASHLAGVDVGTTGVRCAIFTPQGRRLGQAYREYGATYPRPGWVEQDLDQLIASTMEACQAAVAGAGLSAGDIAAVGFSTQRSVTCPVDVDGKPVCQAISWQDARTGEQVAAMRERLDPAVFSAISGLPLGTTWIITKILWLQQQEPELWRRTVRVAQVQDAVLRAFGADGWYSDLSDQAFTGVWDVGNATWSPRLMQAFDLDPGCFSTPTRSGTCVGTIPALVAQKCGFAAGTRIVVGAGDQNCAVIGMGAIEPGMATVTLGTAGLAILSCDRPVEGFGGMMVTNHVMERMWQIEGLTNAAASAFRWFRDTLGQPEAVQPGNAYEHLTRLAAQAPPGSRGLLFLPYLATAGTPHWNPQARAAFLGMSLAHGRAELVRSVLEGVVLEIRDIIARWQGQGMDVARLRIGGGATISTLWNHIQADLYGRPVQTLAEEQSTVLGAAILAGVGAGHFADVRQGVASMVRVADTIDPDPAHHQVYDDLYAAYTAAYRGLSDQGAFAALSALQR